MKPRLFWWRLLARGLTLVVLVSLSACAASGRLGGARPAATTLDSVEAYLARYQPGPLPRLFQTTRLTDRNGVLIAELWDEGRRTWVGIDRVSQHLIDATIAVEDATFYQNTGVDPARIAAAALRNAQEGGVVSGASTITMQLARNLFLGIEQRYDQSMDRKLIEAGLAQELTSLFSKDEIPGDVPQPAELCASDLRAGSCQPGLLRQARRRSRSGRGDPAGRHPAAPCRVRSFHPVRRRQGSPARRARHDGPPRLPDCGTGGRDPCPAGEAQRARPDASTLRRTSSSTRKRRSKPTWAMATWRSGAATRSRRLWTSKLRRWPRSSIRQQVAKV